MSDDQRTAPSVDERREEIIALLADCFAQGALEMDEFERRVEAAHAADSVSSLDAIVADVATTKAQPVAVVAAAKPSPVPAKAKAQALVPQADRSALRQQPESGFVLAMFGGAERKGAWAVPTSMDVTAIIGGADLDYREAQFGPGVHELSVYACLGGIDIIVPPNVLVECNGTAILGGFDNGTAGVAAPDDAPVLRISGFAILGGVDVQSRMPGESKRQARKRRKLELKEKRQRLLSD